MTNQIALEEGNFLALNDSNLLFNLELFGPTYFESLRHEAHAKELRIPTVSELSCLAEYSFENPDKRAAKLIKNFFGYGLTGDTGISYGEEGLFFQDNPCVVTVDHDKFGFSGLILMDEKTLESRLGSDEREGVVFSDDRKIRFVPYGFKVGKQNLSQLSKNPAAIGLFGGQENAERISKFYGQFNSKVYFLVSRQPLNWELGEKCIGVISELVPSSVRNEMRIGGSGAYCPNRHSVRVKGLN